MKAPGIVCIVFTGMVLAGCAGPSDLPLGFGPGLDQFSGIAMLTVLVALAWRLIRNALGSRTDNPSASDILRMRYARGELSEEEYRRMTENLSREKAKSA